MIHIAHRGNLTGSSDSENSPNQIDKCIVSGYEVEVDVWNVGGFYLGHDKATYRVNIEWLRERNQYLWIHAKNIHALHSLKDDFNTFGHDNDDYVLTSKGYIWVYPGKPLVPGCIAVMPERCDYSRDELSACYGICSDFS